MILNRQEKVKLNLADLRAFILRLAKALRVGHERFNVCLVDDQEIAQLNSTYRKKAQPTDVLSFAWDHAATANTADRTPAEFRDFLGDIVISAETARRNARLEGHSTQNEVRWLILHGLLHLKGHDHEKDHGEMTALELALRKRLKVDGPAGRTRRPRARKTE